MRKLKIGIIEITTRSPNRNMYGKVMRANLTSIMPQVIAVWCEQMGHEVHLSYHTGCDVFTDPIPEDCDVVIFSAFTTAAQVAYALGNYYRSKGAIIILGGPHPRSYPEDSIKYFDYALGFTTKPLLQDLLETAAPQRPMGVYLSAPEQPEQLPGVQERWKYIERLFEEAPLLKVVNMIGSLGCPYTCSFCVDSIVKYQPLDFDVMKADLRFVKEKMKRPVVGWHDPNFGVRFNDYLDAIQEAVPPGSVEFVAESTLSLLSEKNVQRLQKNGFKGILPGIESWYDMGYKTKTGKTQGEEKVRHVAEQVNMILSYLPYFQGNFVLGLDTDDGDSPFELTKLFHDLAPGSFPAYSMLTAFGRSAPLNLEYQKADRVIPFPFHFLNNNGAMNVRPKNYAWPDFYDRMIDLHEHSFSKSMIWRRWKGNTGFIPKAMNVLRATTFEGWGKIEYFKNMRRRLDEDRQLRAFFEGDTMEVPPYFVERIKNDLGWLWEWLPEGAVEHDPYAYLKSELPSDLDIATA